ncbi:cell cycle checkpoint control protein RAD9A [Daktulosphaira vitifoliae]|uniref:cell cycle checkpoint control protein RAD9A n=1 Tax=Daktulosphaira vitifoliae TaxID=58002 RepID=UPI0021AA380E|nr:cell cycle checkpoint control protein RAD9A [Daktulosphaira vitifoliae]
MKCVIPKQNLKILSRALNTMCRIGEDLYIEPNSTQLVMHTTNSWHTVYAWFTFDSSFFSSYYFTEDDEQNSENSLKCKISLKSCIMIFKSPHLARCLESCHIEIKNNVDNITIQLRYSNFCIKTHLIPVLEYSALQVNQNVESSYLLCIDSKALSAAVKHFQNNETDITMEVTSEKVLLRSHPESCRDIRKMLRTELSLQSSEFEVYDVGNGSCVTFCLKEIRPLLAFAEHISIPVSIRFSTPGMPMVFGLKNGLTFEGQYILSTMTDNLLTGNGGSLPIRINVNAIENTQSSDGRHENNLPINHHTQLGNSHLRTPMRVQVEYPDSISRKRRIQSISDQPSKKFNPNSKSIFEQNCIDDDDELLSQIVDFPVNDVPSVSGVNDGHLTLGLSETGRVFARCLTLPLIEKSPKKGKVIVYDSDGLGSESE